MVAHGECGTEQERPSIDAATEACSLSEYSASVPDERLVTQGVTSLSGHQRDRDGLEGAGRAVA
jgi:hypothetical protein